MKKIDCLGEMCPIPILKVQQELDHIKKGMPLMVVIDSSCTLPKVKEFCEMHNLAFYEQEVMHSIWEIVIFSK